MTTFLFEVNGKTVNLDNLTDLRLRGSLSSIRDRISEKIATVHCPKCDQNDITILISFVGDGFGGLGPTLTAFTYCHLEFFDLVRSNLPDGFYLQGY